MVRIKAILLILIFLILAFLIAKKPQKIVTYTLNQDTVTKQLVQKCEESSDWRDCYGAEFSKLVKNDTISLTLAVLNQVEMLDTKTRDCHIIAHYISSAAVAKNPKDWKNFLSLVDIDSCNYGFIHGTLEGVAMYDKSFEITPQSIPRICGIIGQISKSAGTDQGCAHIMGHLLLSDKCEGSVEEAIGETVNDCSSLPPTFQHECYAGNFMESFTRDNLQHSCGTEHIPWNQQTITNQERICRSYTGDAASSCWQEISHMYNALTPYNPTAVYNACNHAPTRQFVLSCYIHAVNTLVTNNNPSPQYFASVCAPLASISQDYNMCMRNAVGSMIYASTKFAPTAAMFCDSLPNKNQSTCFSTVASLLQRRVALSEKSTACQILKEPYRTECEK